MSKEVRDKMYHTASFILDDFIEAVYNNDAYTKFNWECPIRKIFGEDSPDSYIKSVYNYPFTSLKVGHVITCEKTLDKPPVLDDFKVSYQKFDFDADGVKYTVTVRFLGFHEYMDVKVEAKDVSNEFGDQVAVIKEGLVIGHCTSKLDIIETLHKGPTRNQINLDRLERVRNLFNDTQMCTER